MQRTHLLAGLCLALVGCGTPMITQDQYIHSLTVRPNGNLLPLTVQEGRWDIPAQPKRTMAAKLGHIKATKRFRDAKRILIFVHGGLNTLDGGLQRTKDTAPCITWDTKGETYPIFINWNSDLGAAYGDHLLHYRKGKKIQDFWGAVSAPFILLADFGRAIARIPIVFFDQGSAAFGRLWRASVPDYREGGEPGQRRLRVREPQYMGTVLKAEWEQRVVIDPRYEWSSWDKWVDTITQVVPGVLRVATTPIVDAVGFAGYDMVQRRVDTLFYTNDDLKSRTTQPNGALYQLINSIDKSKPIVLIGHSMGTIVLNEVVRQFPHHEFENIVYMGAACTIKDFMDAVPEYLHEHERTKFYNLCLHPAADENEVSLLSLVPNGSLLEWLDAYVLGPRTPMFRTMGKWDNILSVLNVLNGLEPEVKARIHIKGFPVLGDRFPNAHGTFDNFKFWDPRFWNPQHRDGVETIASIQQRMNQPVRMDQR